MTSNAGSEDFASSAVDQLGIWDRGRLCLRLLRDPGVSMWLKAGVPVATAVYVLSPIDLIPDFLLGVGQLDDLGVIGIAIVLLLRWVPRLAPKRIVADHLAEMGFGMHEGNRDDGPTRENAGRIVDAAFRVNQHDAGEAPAA